MCSSLPWLGFFVPVNVCGTCTSEALDRRPLPLEGMPCPCMASLSLWVTAGRNASCWLQRTACSMTSWVVHTVSPLKGVHASVAGLGSALMCSSSGISTSVPPHEYSCL